MTKLYDELSAMIKKIDDAARSGEIKSDEIMFLSGMMSGAGWKLADKYRDKRGMNK